MSTSNYCTGSLGSSSSSKQNGHAMLKKQLFATVRSDKHIQKFVVCAVPSKKELGKGSWGSTIEVSFRIPDLIITFCTLVGGS